MRATKGLRKRKRSFVKVRSCMRTTHGYPPNLWDKSPDHSAAILYHWLRVNIMHPLLNADFYSVQPNIYLLVETLLRQQTSTFGATFTVTRQFARTAERSPHFCDACTLTTARDICPENTLLAACKSHRLCPAKLECFIAPLTR